MTAHRSRSSRAETSGIATRALHPALGLEVLGIDLAAALDDAVLAEIERLWQAHLVLVFRGQSLTEERQLALTRRYGDLDIVSERSARSQSYQPIMRVQATEAGIGDAAAPRPFVGGITELWHTDGAYRPNPSYISMLHALQVPESGGETCFANCIAAYQAMPAGLRARIEGKHMVHSYAFSRIVVPGLPPIPEEDLRRYPPATHPVVRTQGDGRKSVYINNAVGYYIGGMPFEDGKRLFDEVIAWTTQPDFVYRHHWQKGDVVIWDNRATLHKVMPYDLRQKRVMQRTEVRGTEYPA